MSEPIPILRVDTAANFAARKYTRSEQLRRVLWFFGRWLMLLSPRLFFGWRRMKCCGGLFGARVGQHARVYSSTHVYMPWNVTIGDWAAIGEHVFIYSLGRVTIGEHANVSYRSHICAGTHDFNDPALPPVKPPVTLEARAWVGTESFIGPGVTVGSGAIVGARAVVVKSVRPLDIVVGNPARSVGTRRLP